MKAEKLLKASKCKVCERIFFVSKFSSGWFCSKTCRKIWRKQKDHQRYERNKTFGKVIVKVKCPVCGIYFERKGSKKITCSPPCSRKRRLERMRKIRRERYKFACLCNRPAPRYYSVTANLNLIKVNGQERVKGMVVLEKLITQRRTNP